MSSNELTQGIKIEIRVNGILGETTKSWFDGMEISADNDVSLIQGIIPDQQSAYGLINRLRDLGISIISIKVGSNI